MESDGSSAPRDDHHRRRRRQRVVDKQRGRCASCRGGLSADTARVRVEVYRIGDGLDDGELSELDELNADEIRVAYAQCAPCFGLERPRAAASGRLRALHAARLVLCAVSTPLVGRGDEPLE